MTILKLRDELLVKFHGIHLNHCDLYISQAIF